MPVSYDDVVRASKRIAGIAHRTPVVTSRTLDERAGAASFIKCENLQRMGAFKFRGAYNRLAQMDEAQRRGGVVAYSSGNHAQGVALAAQLLGIPAVIVMPRDAPQSKLAATRGYGAEVVLYERSEENRALIAAGIAQEHGATLVPPYDDEAIIAGAGTAALELFEDVDRIDTLVVPLGGGGLFSGACVVARHVDPTIACWGVEPVAGDDVRQSYAAKKRITIDVPKTIADGLQTQSPGELTFPIIRDLAAGIITVTDDELVDAMRFAFERLKLVVEPSGAAALAAVLNKRIPGAGKRIGIVITGGNIDAARFTGLVQRDSEPGTARPIV